MKKMFLLLFLFAFAPMFLMGQQMIQSFDTQLDSTYWGYESSASSDSTKSFIIQTLNEENFIEGTGSMQVEYSAENIESWGGYTKIEYIAPGAEVLDWSAYDSVSFWYNNVVAQNLPGRVHLRFELYDVSDVPDTTSVGGDTEFYYSFQYILDSLPGWKEWKMPLVDGRGNPNLDEWNGEAFNRTGWAGVQGNDVLDPDKIKGFAFEFSISGAGEGDVGFGTLLLDALMLKGSKNSISMNPGFEDSLAHWGTAFADGAYADIKSEGAFAGENYLELGVPDNAWSVAWYDSIPANFKEEWKASAFIKDFSAADFEGASYAAMKLEAHAADQSLITDFGGDQIIQGVTKEWKQFSISEVMPEGTAYVTVALVATKWVGDGVPAAYGFDDISALSLGVLDDIPPDAPQGVAATANPTNYFNLVVWQDVPGESEETYNVYASENPITDVNADGVELIAAKVDENIQTTVHYLRYPLNDTEVSYHYAVTCTDKAGNVSEVAASAGATTNTAEGVSTIADTPPATFAVDGVITDWDDSGIQPFDISPETGNVAAGTVTDASDLNGIVYLAMDADNLYVFADVIDDGYFFGEGNWWDQDALQIFIGLYNQTKVHTTINRGAEPDVIVYFNEQRLVRDNPGGVTLYAPGDENYYFESFGASDYVIEAKIPFDSLLIDGDAAFEPVRGMRIPIDIYFHDNDGSGWEGNVGLSPNSTDQQWNNPQEWTYTWIGDTNKVATAIGDVAKIANRFELKQNYPNPFNPTTTIEYSLAYATKAKVTVFNMLGQELKVLADGKHTAGTHMVSFDATQYASGVYFYQIETDNFVQTRKMLLVK